MCIFNIVATSQTGSVMNWLGNCFSLSLLSYVYASLECLSALVEGYRFEA